MRVSRLRRTPITATFNISGAAASGPRNVTVTFGSTSSNSRSFKVQVPKFFGVSSASAVSKSLLGCATDRDGYAIQVVYQVQDQDGMPILKSGLTPREIQRQRNCAFSSPYLPFASPQATNSQGLFTDIPLGTCVPTNLSNACVEVDQKFDVLVPGVGSPFPIATVTERKDCRYGLGLTVKNGSQIVHSQNFANTTHSGILVCVL